MSPPTTLADAAVDDDRQLLAQFVRTASPAPFESLVRRHSPMVLAVCRRKLAPADAEDAAQAVFVLLWQKARQIKAEATAAGWLHRTAEHVCRNAVRMRARRHQHEQQAAREMTAMQHATTDDASGREIREILDAEVDRLPDKLRIPFILFHLENRSMAEVAAMLGASVSSVGTWLQRGREQLAERLRRRGVAVGGAAALAALLTEQTSAAAVSSQFVAATVHAAATYAAGGVAAGTTCSPSVAALVKAGSVGAKLSLKLCWIAGLPLAALTLYLAVTWFFPMVQTRTSADFASLQGEWIEVGMEQSGGALIVESPVEYVGRLVISGRSFRRFQTLADGRTLPAETGTFVLDDAQMPKAIDFKILWGFRQVDGIYRVAGDELSLCVVRDAGARPDAFVTAPNDDRILTRYRRVRAAGE